MVMEYGHPNLSEPILGKIPKPPDKYTQGVDSKTTDAVSSHDGGNPLMKASRFKYPEKS
jgi:hypothetical protein